jgi:glycosyltransferase involved in cell wall biosynthesis/peptidoglycan/xylan/chitin deacetylase (PgdA/CDA1 family)
VTGTGSPAPPPPAGPPDGVRHRYSIVVPTFQRRDVVAASVTTLAAQDGPAFEVIVVVDGSTDGTADTLRALDMPFPLRVVEQPNSGASRARNYGARLAAGDVLLFLDDDMRAAPDLLRAHEDAYAKGADAVIGHVPVHPDTPRTFLSRGLEGWADGRARRLAGSGGELTVSDLLTGQLSVRREVFAALGGFDEDFTRGGSFGGEDTDFGQRLLAGGYRLVFSPAAVSWQYYVVSPAAYLRQWHQAGHADVLYLRKHPGEVDRVYRSHRPDSRVNRYLWRPLVRVPVLSTVCAAAARRAVIAAAARVPDDRRIGRVFFRVRDLEYWRGVQRAGGIPARRPVRVLCYHALSDLAGSAVIEEYGVPAARFRRQLRTLRRAGFRFVTLDEVLCSIERAGGLPRRALLVTFDDCYADLLEVGVPILRDERVPAVAFAVAGLTGGGNDWDTARGAPPLRLLDADGLRALERSGIEIGVHGRTHRPLVGLTDAELAEETSGAAAALAALGLSRPRVFAYPHGEHDERVRRQLGAATFRAAFTVTSGLVRPAEPDRYALPRVEVLRRDGEGARLLGKVLLAGRLPHLRPAVRRAARGLPGVGAGRTVRRRRRRGDGSPAPVAGTAGYQRVAIVGGSATGKTDLAAALAVALDLPHVKLDDLRWGGGPTATDEQFAAALAEATRGPRWVIEGAEESPPVRSAWHRADAVVWLDHSRAGVAARMFADTPWLHGRPGDRSRLAYLSHLVRKSGRSWRQATHLRRALPPVLDRLRADGIDVVRLRSVGATRRWRALMALPSSRTGASEERLRRLSCED